jgi:hypothetical protein
MFVKNVNELNGERLVLGKNFLTLSDNNMDFYYKPIEEILLIAKMSGYDFFFSSNRGVKSFVSGNKCVDEHLPKKASDMINIKYAHNMHTIFYLTLTYQQDDYSFCEFGINPMTHNIQKIVLECSDHKSIRHSDYFYATNNFNDIQKVLNCAMEIVKKI